MISEKGTVIVVATLDTKGPEADFVRKQISTWGLNTLLVDAGILGTPVVKADISREMVASAAGTTIEALVEAGQKSTAIAKQAEGLGRILLNLLEQGNLTGIIGLGGGQGTAICTAAMRKLPIGVPKLMLSTVASGRLQFGPYVGTKDICMMFSVTDIMGINAISRPILINAANAIAGMVMSRQTDSHTEKPTIAITMLGITTPCVMRLKRNLEPLGFDVVPFHAVGSGGAAMEELIEAGRFAAVIDLSTHELINHLNNGLVGTPGRFEALTRFKIPAVISVGGIGVLAFESLEKAPEKYRNRPYIVHNDQITHVRPTPEEMIEAANVMVERLNRALGPTLVIWPKKGSSEVNREGAPLWGPDGNQAMLATLQAGLRAEVPLILVDAHINDPDFADVVAKCTERLLQGESPQSIAARFNKTSES